MNSLATKGIHISVESNYQPEYSKPVLHEYVFAYHILIENQSNRPVKLLSRHWFIFDSVGQYTEVVGDGVVGQTPSLEPGQQFTYSSSCHLHSDMGRMKGRYTMEDTDTGNRFMVDIPAFDLVADFKEN